MEKTLKIVDNFAIENDFSLLRLSEALSIRRSDKETLAERNIVKYLYSYLDYLKAKTMIVEDDYTDADYLDDHSHYYVKCHASYPRHCRRLHFFAMNGQHLEREEFLSYVARTAEQAEFDRFCNSYRGFIVARPLPRKIIGRTVLQIYPEGQKEEDPRFERQYKCVKEYKANLFGIPLTIKKSLAFQEQDHVVAACATISLWCCFQKTSELFGTATAPSPAHITERANQFLSRRREYPSSGLLLEQMCEAVRSNGLTPEVIEINKNLPFVSMIYSYLKMEIPVVIGCFIPTRGNHAITITGYSIGDHRVRDRETPLEETHEISKENPKENPKVTLPGLRIDEFYAHDDQVGPFAKLKIMEWRKLPALNSTLRKKSEYQEKLTQEIHKLKNKLHSLCFIGSEDGGWVGEDGKLLPLFPWVLIVPLYHKIRIGFRDLNWITELDEFVKRAFKINENELEWDLRLITNKNFKEQIVEDDTIDKAIALKVLKTQYPRYLWFITLKIRNRIVTELVVDATDFEGPPPICSVIWVEDILKQMFSAALQIKEYAELLSDDIFNILTKSASESVYINTDLNEPHID